MFLIPVAPQPSVNKSLVFGHSAALGVTDVVSTMCVRALLLMERKFVLNKSRPHF